jgi:N-acetyl-anhydromuramyl-L-alanine amidase AmpD
MVPIGIVDHISEGTFSSLIHWFTDPNNKNSSSHFGVARDGRVVQFVSIENMAWCNGPIKDPTSDLVNMIGLNVNPNLYTVSIEHEGVYRFTNGRLTEDQLDTTVKLHAYIIAYVKKYFDFNIAVNRTNILGHYEIDQINKINCPGQSFPFDEIISRVKGSITNEPFSDIFSHWAHDIILEANKLGIVSGDGTKYFKPDNPCTRAEVVAMIMNVYKVLKR